MSDELKPCPFCGEAVEMNDYTDKPACAWVMIHRCKVIGPIKLENYSGEILQKDWNTRSDTDALTAAQEENERLVHDIERLSASLSAEVTGSEKLREALKFYADTSKYPAPLTGGQGELYYDCGQIARAALNGLPR